MRQSKSLDESSLNLSIAFEIFTSLGRTSNLQELCKTFLSKMTERFQMLGGEFWVNFGFELKKVSTVGSSDYQFPIEREVDILKNQSKNIIYKQLSTRAKLKCNLDLAIIPLIMKEKLVGAVILYIQSKRKLTRNEEGIIESVKDILINYINNFLSYEELSKVEQLQRKLLDTIGTAIIIVKEGIIKYANRYAEILTGYPAEDWIGRTVLDIIHPDDKKTVMKFLTQRRKGDVGQLNYNVRIIASDGEIKWVNVNSEVIDYEGELVAFITAVEITKLKETQRELEYSRERYKRLVETSPVGILIFRDDNILYANPAFLKIFKLSGNIDEIDLKKLFSKEDISNFRKIEREVLSGKYEVVNDILDAYSNDGVPLIVNSYTTKMIYDDEPAVSMSVLDITEQIRMQRDIEASERKYRNLIQSLQSGVAIIQGGEIRFANKSLENFLECEASKLIGKDFIKFVFSEDEVKVRRIVHEVDGDLNVSPIDIRFITNDGRMVCGNSQFTLTDYEGERSILINIVDITERKEIEEALVRSEKYYRTLFENASLPVVLTSGNMMFVDVNKAFEKLFGYSRAEIRNCKISTILANEFEDKVEKIHKVRRVAPNKAPKTYEVIAVTKQGIPKIIRVTSEMIEGTDIDIAFLEDITKEKEMYYSLEESEERYRSLAEISPVGIVIFDNERILFKNNRINELIEISEDSVSFNNLLGAIVPEDREVFISTYKDVMAKKTKMEILEVKMVRGSSDENLFVEIRMVPISYKGKKAVLANLVNITLLRRAMAQLMASEMKYRALVENLPVGIAIHSSSQIVYINKAFEEITGFNLKAGMKITDIVLNKDADLLRNRLKLIIDGIVRTFKKEVCLSSSSSGENKYVFISMNRIFYDARPSVLLGIIDITDRVKAEEALKKAHEEVKNAHAELKKLDAVKTEFINVLSHELKTPLTSIIGYTEIFRDGLLGPLTPTQRETIKSLHTSSKRLGDLVDDLLDYSRLELGKIKMTKEKSDLNEIIQQSINEMGPLAVEKGITIKFEKKILPPIMIDKYRITQLVNNLLSNAIKFSPSNSTVNIFEMKRGDEVEISIRDEGPGIPENELDRIFDKFYQVDMSDGRTERGMGLGLAISKAIVEGHDGKIWVESKLGQGSIFHFTLKL
ncbi:MAG: PAS domain S-box protein [bacterium]